MRTTLLAAFTSCVLTLCVTACNDSRDSSDDPEQTPCDPTRHPIIMVHGFLASGDTWASFAQRFLSNGYCPDSLHALDWNSLTREGAAEQLAALVTQTLKDTGADKLDIVAHSAGGRLAYEYLAALDSKGAARIAHYVQVGSFTVDGPPEPAGKAIPMLHVWSSADTAIEDKGDVQGATNVRVKGLDHYQVATAAQVFKAVYTFVNDGAAPETTGITRDGKVAISGRVLSLGTNTPSANATVTLWVLSPGTADRDGEPAGTVRADAQGRFGPVPVEPGSYYELEVTEAQTGATAIHYYREPFVRSHGFVYLRTLPPSGDPAAVIVSSLPLASKDTVLVSFTSSTGLVPGRDSLTVDGKELVSEELTPASKTVIATFLFDDDADGKTSRTPIASLASLTFLTGADFFFGTTRPRSIPVKLGARTLYARNWSANAGGVAITVFD